MEDYTFYSFQMQLMNSIS
uniref:Uncharacterized protein n=1 Tax=Anguilla anguilla TaxID=7936 RepID=A0A0E9T188_ANGAN